MARGARRPRSVFAGALEPMTEADVVYYEKEGGDLVSIRAVDPIRASFSLSTELERALLLPAMAESLETFVSEADPAEPFYRLARHAMDALFAGGKSALTAAYFDVWILKLSGLFPSLRECAGCGAALPESGPSHLRRAAARVRRRRVPGRRGDPPVRAGRARPSRDSSPARSTRPPTRRAFPRSSAVARLSRRHFLGHELKSQRVLSEVLG